MNYPGLAPLDSREPDIVPKTTPGNELDVVDRIVDPKLFPLNKRTPDNDLALDGLITGLKYGQLGGSRVASTASFDEERVHSQVKHNEVLIQLVCIEHIMSEIYTRLNGSMVLYCGHII